MQPTEELLDRAKALSQLPTPELVSRAIEIATAHPDPDDDERHVYWVLVGTMHERGGQTEFDAARSLVGNAGAIERELGCDILGQLGWGKTFVEDSVDLLIERSG